MLTPSVIFGTQEYTEFTAAGRPQDISQDRV